LRRIPIPPPCSSSNPCSSGEKCVSGGCVPEKCGEDYSCGDTEESQDYFCSDDGTESVYTYVTTYPCDIPSNTCAAAETNQKLVKTCTGTDVCDYGECIPFDCNYYPCPTTTDRCNQETGQCQPPCQSNSDCPAANSESDTAVKMEIA